MKLVVQRVKKGSVSVDGKLVSQIGLGLFVLIGVREGDNNKDAEALVSKLAKLRVMADDKKKMNLSVVDAGGEVLAVSQFTLNADTKKGNRPSFIKSAEPKVAKDIYKYFVAKLRELGVKVETGEFGEYMMIDVELDGPVTIVLDTNE